MRNLAVLLIAASMLPTAGAQEKTKKGPPPKLTSAVIKTADQLYRKTAQGELFMHLYYPPDWKASDKRPAIVFYFGGGWKNGSHTQFMPQAQYFASRGLVCACADYRIESKHKTTPDACIEDAKAAVRWMRSNAGKLGIDPDKLIASGGSSGGHLAAATSLCEGFDAIGDNTKISCKPNALVLFNPALNMSGGKKPVTDASGRDISKEFSPTLFLKKGTPPTIIFFGTADTLLAHGDEYLKKSRDLGNRVELYTAADMPHGFFNRSPWNEVTAQKTDEFLASLGYLKGPPTLKLPADAKPLQVRKMIPLQNLGLQKETNMNRGLFAASLFVALAIPASAQDWKSVTDALIVAEKPGFGGLCGVIVDHKTGDVTINLSDKGFYRSADAGKTWTRVGMPFKGRTETPGCMMLDPFGGKRLVAALVYGSSILVSPDRGDDWKALDKKSAHVDWCAVDWSDPELKFILTLKHEAADLLLVSRDGGKSFDEVGKGYGPAWIFDGQTAVVAQARSKANPKPGILRTTDGGKTFQPSGEYFAKALPRWHKNSLYWLTDGALIKTGDQGKTWTKLSDIKGSVFGPIFGKDDKHLFVLAQSGILESTDGGASWQKPIAIPKGMKSVANLSWLEYDPSRDTLYVMKMGSELYQLKR